MSFDDSNSQNTVTSLRGRLIDSDTSADELALDYPSTMFRTKRQKKEQTCPSTPRSTREESHSTQEYFLPLDDRRGRRIPRWRGIPRGVSLDDRHGQAYT